MTFARFNHKCCLLAATSFVALVSAGVAQADDDTATETVVVTGTAFNTEDAPAKASLTTEQPQTIIDRSYIDNFTPPTADYVSILAIAVGMTGTDANGPGLSDGGVKNTLRGFPDGNFALMYDGLSFGDTNGPTHHNVSYFPGQIIGSAIVDRGPGAASTLAPNTYGGTIKLFSPALTDQAQGNGLASYGSFNTRIVDASAQTGEFGDGTRLLVNFMNTASDGALSFQDLADTNYMFKVSHDFGDNWALTVFGTYEDLREHLEDNNGATPAQIMAYGKNFAMQDTNPALPDYNLYNWTTKRTDFEYAKLTGTIVDGLKLDNTFYTYAYFNHTFSVGDNEQTATDIAAGTAENLTGSKYTPVVNGVARPGDVPGYAKQNQYRVWGDQTKLSYDFAFTDFTGQLRTGIWWEGQATERARYYYDITLCDQLGINPFHTANVAACTDSSEFLQKKAAATPHGYANTDEHTQWYQYEPYVEADLHPFTDDLTITPGYRYIDWLHKTDSEVEPKSLLPFQDEYTTTQGLFFAAANYKITKSWSVYAQYAQGIYVPDISTFEQALPPAGFPAAETTTTYQIGTVFYADKFTFDADIYTIPVNNNYSEVPCSTVGGPVGDTCPVDTGRALYKGVEGEATYEVMHGLSIFANGGLYSSRSNGLFLANAPFWTTAAGILYNTNHWKFSFIGKYVGPEYDDAADNPLYKMPAYAEFNTTAGYNFGHVEVDLTVSNLFNSRAVTAITEAGSNAGFTPQSLDQYFYQAPRSAMLTMRFHI